MTTLAAHLNDAAITVLSNERLLYREPGFALLDEDGIQTGVAAERASRLYPRRVSSSHWDQLTTDALPLSRFSHLTAADLVSRQLEQIWQSAGGQADRLLLAVPPYMGRDALSLLLGIAGDLQIPVSGLVDSAAAATRREYRNAVPVHIDISLHRAMLTRVRQDGQALVERAELIDSSGLVQLYDAWIRAIAGAFVRQSRFDPLHTAATEQLLLDSLPDWLAQAARADAVPMRIDYQGVSHEAEFASLDLIAVAAPVYQRIVSQLRALLKANELPAIQLADRAARLPGLADMLTARAGGDVFLLEPGATARGLLSRAAEESQAGAAYSLRKSLPFDQAAIDIERRSDEHAVELPTHILFGDTAYAVDERPLVLGSQQPGSGRFLEFPRDMPGVSRQHCTLSRSNGQCVVEDHSRYGTFLNGHRIEGSAVLQSGDQLRIGTPGFELRLIRTEA